MKFGGTPLHWSSSREVIDSLIANNCDINALNFDKRTALHIMVLFVLQLEVNQIQISIIKFSIFVDKLNFVNQKLNFYYKVVFNLS